MKPYVDLNGKAHWSIFWGDKLKKKARRTFKKSARKKLSTSAKKFIEDQQFIHEYLNGNKTIEDLNERGIKLAKFN